MCKSLNNRPHRFWCLQEPLMILTHDTQYYINDKTPQCSAWLL